MLRSHQKRKKQSCALLGAIELFLEMTDDTLVRYVPYFRWIKVRADQVLIQVGDASDHARWWWCPVPSRLQQLNTIRKKLMAFIKPGTMLSEMGLITNEPRYATCKAISEGEVGLLLIEQFEMMKKRSRSAYCFGFTHDHTFGQTVKDVTD